MLLFLLQRDQLCLHALDTGLQRRDVRPRNGSVLARVEVLAPRVVSLAGIASW
jgi:hypothetical protein